MKEKTEFILTTIGGIIFGIILAVVLIHLFPPNAIEETTPTEPCALSNNVACQEGCLIMLEVIYGDEANWTGEDFVRREVEHCKCANRCRQKFNPSEFEFY